MVYYCSVKGCKSSSREKKVLFRRFPPVTTNIFKQWVLATGREELQKLDPIFIRTNKRICNLHFPHYISLLPKFRDEYYPLLTENLQPVLIKDVDMQVDPLVNSANINELDCKLKIPKTDDVQPLTHNKVVISKEIASLNASDRLTVKEETIANSDINTTIATTKSASTQTIESGYTNSSTNFKPMGFVNNNNGTMNMNNEVITVFKNLDDEQLKKNIKSAKCKQCIRTQSMETKNLKNQIRNLKAAKEKYKTECKKFADFQYLDDRVQNFIRSQLTNADKKSKGEKYTHEDKLFALNIYRHSKLCYNFLSNIFRLPSLTTLKNLKRDNPHVFTKIACNE